MNFNVFKLIWNKEFIFCVRVVFLIEDCCCYIVFKVNMYCKLRLICKLDFYFGIVYVLFFFKNM